MSKGMLIVLMAGLVLCIGLVFAEAPNDVCYAPYTVVQ